MFLNLMSDLEKKVEETRTLPDGSELKIEIYPLQNTVGLIDSRKGVVEKVLRVKLQRKDNPLMTRSSSPRKSWDIPESKYWGIFRKVADYRQAVKIIENINGAQGKWDGNIYF